MKLYSIKLSKGRQHSSLHRLRVKGISSGVRQMPHPIIEGYGRFIQVPGLGGSSIFKGILFRVGGESEIDPGPNVSSDGGQIHTDEYS